MAKPTGKLKFAYETIANMEAKIKELKKELDDLTCDAYHMRYHIHQTGLDGWDPKQREIMEKILYDENDKVKR